MGMKKLSLVLVFFLIISTLGTASFAATSSSQTITKIYGVGYSPYIKVGQSPNIGSQISETQLKETIKTIAPYTKWIRTYGCTGSLVNVGLLAHKSGLKIAVGAWLSKDLKANDKEIASLIKIAKAGQADTLIVGSEVLYRGDLTEAQLIAYIAKVKKAVPKMTVTTADTAGIFLQHLPIINLVDVVYANIYPYWEGIEIKEAMKSFNTQYGLLKKAAKNKQVIVSETGWPSSGKTVGKAVPSVANEAFYFQNFVSWAKVNKAAYFYFEAFDEAWKGSTQNPQEAYWGLWNKSMKMKTGINDVFKGKVMKDNWTIPESVFDTKLPDLLIKDIPFIYRFSAYGSAALDEFTDVNTFTMSVKKSDTTWGSVAADVGTGLGKDPLDLSKYKYVILHMKGAKGGEKFMFGFGYGPTDYLYSQGLTTNWQDIVIDISTNKSNMKDVFQFGFELGKEWTKNAAGTTIYVDGIKFSNNLPTSPYVVLK